MCHGHSQKLSVLSTGVAGSLILDIVHTHPASTTASQSSSLKKCKCISADTNRRCNSHSDRSGSGTL